MVQEVTEFCETPPELAALTGIGIVSAAVAQKFQVQPKAGYTEPL